MDSYWKSKVLPKLKKVFETNKNGEKKTAAAEANKAFDDSKVEIDKEFEEKKTELQPKVLVIYEAAPAKIKSLVKERKEAGVKKNSAAVTKFLEELAKIDFPGAKKVSEIVTSYGAALVPVPVLYILDKVSTLLPVEETPDTVTAAAAAPEEKKTAVQESSGSKDREVVVAAEEEKKQAEAEEMAAPEASATEEAAELDKPAEEEAPKA